MSVPRFDRAVRRDAGNPIIALGGVGSPYEMQVFDQQIVIDPADATQLIMYASGLAAPVQLGEMSILRFTAPVADPNTWTYIGQVLTKGGGSSWDQDHARMASVVYAGGTWYLYYSGINGSTIQCGLATSADGLTFTKHASNPILTPTGQGRTDGDSVEFPVVINEGGAWTMIYAYRDGLRILPGFRYATSPDGIAWTKGGAGDILTTDPFQCEGHQLLKIGSTYWLLYDAGTQAIEPYQIYATASGSPIGPFQRGRVLIPPSRVPGAWDRYHTANVYVVEIASGVWRVYYSAAGDHDQPYGTNTWPIGVALLPTLDGDIQTAGSVGRGGM